MSRYILIIALFLGVALHAAAQGPDTVKVKTAADNLNNLNRKRDSATAKPLKPFAQPKNTKIKIYHPDSTHSPGLAFRRSGFIPGWGQVYNHSYWKVPLIYGGLGALGYNLVDNFRLYKQFLAIARYQRDPSNPPKEGDPYYAAYKTYGSRPPQTIIDAKDGYNRNFQICILSIAVVWGVQMIEAYIQAKFIHSYTMDNDLSFKITPSIIGSPAYAAGNSNVLGSAFTPGLTATLNF
jgi:hypothetical protein